MIILDGNSSSNGTEEIHFQLFSFDWESVRAPYTVGIWLLMASVGKILFHVNKQFGETVPDSALLIVLGAAVGAFFRLCNVDHSIYTFTHHTFFHYLLPPIIFDAGFFMPNRQLFENFDSVLLFAFVGTIWNTLAIGFSLLWLHQLDWFSVPFSQFQILLFASLISAVDPVAVIAVFEEIHINEFLFINVFGEALFNDGVSVVLYKMFREFALIGQTNLDAFDYIQGIISFLFISIGGVLIGLLFALFACIATKYTNHVRILALVFIFIIPYMAYMTAEMFGLSSILAIIACGISMKQYVKGNLTHDAYSAVKYFVKMLAQSSETVIFMFLGLSTVSRDLVWDWAFVGTTIAFCLLYRVVGVVVQCAVLNQFRRKRFSYTDQFVLSYGGLRGAIAFGLAISTLPSPQFPARQMFITTCLAVIFFTVFVQGISIRPLLFWLKVENQLEREEELMGEKIFARFTDYTMAGLEEIAGQRGKNYFRDCFERFNAKVLKPALMRGEERKPFDASPIVRAYRKITLQEAVKLAQSSCRISMKSHKINQIGGQQSLPSAILRTTSHGAADHLRMHRMEDMDKLLSNRDNVDFLYSLFSRLLDRKMEEVRATRRDSGREDDIKDDYIKGIIGCCATGNVASSPGQQAAADRQLPLLPIPSSNSHKLIRRESTSPGQLCAMTAKVNGGTEAISNNGNGNGGGCFMASASRKWRRLSHPSSAKGDGQQPQKRTRFQIGTNNSKDHAEMNNGGVKKKKASDSPV